jgi:hypothetical protein
MSAVGVCASSNKGVESEGFLRARCEVNGSGRDCRLLDINSRRAFVESFVPAITGSEVTLQFRLPNGHHVCTTGVVTNHQFTLGFDVDFTELSSRDREQINKLLA